MEDEVVDVNALVMGGIKTLRAKEKRMPTTMADQSLILFLCIRGKKTLIRRVALILQKLVFPDDIYLFFYSINEEEKEVPTKKPKQKQEKDGFGAGFHVITLPLALVTAANAALVDSVVRACHQRVYKIANLPVSFTLSEKETRRLAEHVLSRQGFDGDEKAALNLVLGELDRLLETIDSYYNKRLFVSCPLFKNAIMTGDDHDEEQEDAICRFHLATEAKSEEIFFSRYPCMQGTSEIPEKRDRSILSLCIENGWPVPYLSFYHPRHHVSCL